LQEDAAFYEAVLVFTKRLFMYSREFQLLLHCARSRPDAELVRDLVSSGIDWQILLQLAARHCVRSIVLQSLKSVCWAAVPQNTQLELTRFNKANLEKNLRFTGELIRLIGLFQQNAIPIAAFKGPVLAHSVYGHLSLREFSDLDIIVHDADVSKAESILTSCGYRADFADRDYRSAFLSYQGQYAFRHPKTAISVDLHWRLSPLHSAEIWSRLGQLTIADRTIPTLADHDLALLLAAHGTKEGWSDLAWVCDFAEFLRQHQDMDWVAVFRLAQRARCSRPLLLATLLATTLLGAPAPPELLHKARNKSAIRSLAEGAKLRMLRAAPEGEFREFLNWFNTHDHLKDRLVCVVTLLTTLTVGDYEAMPLPKSLWAVYYLTRPFRLAIKGMGMMLWAMKSV
jgi:hypothetical protein